MRDLPQTTLLELEERDRVERLQGSDQHWF